VPTDGAFPFSYSLDSIGPMARTVKACADADAVMAGEEPQPLEPVSLKGLRFGVAQGRPLDGLDGHVAERFGQALTMLGRAGCQLHDEKIALLDELPRINAKGSLLNAEGLRFMRIGSTGEQNPLILMSAHFLSAEGRCLRLI
jgi:aspartyl-tRNA(Asn)/glutamyl-tRNA(Gln) amidotransferase subunit A